MAEKQALAGDSERLQMSPSERGRSCVLLVEPDAIDRNIMRSAIKSLGFGGLSDAASHAAGIERLDQRKFTHVIFDAKSTNMPTSDFLHKLMEINPSMICIPSSYEPDVDDVFDLLIHGAKGYLVKPFTADTLDDAIVNATKGDPIADVVLNAKDRNEALVAILIQCLDNAATILRQAQQFETAKREMPKAMRNFQRSSELALTFAKGGEEGLMEALEKFCIERGKGPATRLGRLRKRLKTKRVVDDEGDNAAP